MEKVSQSKFHEYQKVFLTKEELVSIVNIFLSRPADKKIFQLNNLRYSEEEVPLFLDNIQNSELISTFKIDSHYYNDENRNLYLSLELTRDTAKFYTNNDLSKEYFEVRDKIDEILLKVEKEDERESYSKWIYESFTIYIDGFDRILSIIASHCEDIEVKINNKLVNLYGSNGLSFRAVNSEQVKTPLKVDISGTLNRKVLSKGFLFNSRDDEIEVNISESGVYIRATDKENSEIREMIREIRDALDSFNSQKQRLSIIERVGNPGIIIPIALVWSVIFSSIIYIFFNSTVLKTMIIFFLIFSLTVLFGILVGLNRQVVKNSENKIILILADRPPEEPSAQNRSLVAMGSFIRQNIGAVIVGIVIVLVEHFIFPS